MKRIFVGLLLGFMLCSIDTRATDYYQLMRAQLVGFGETIESVNNVPLINKLTNLPPFAIIATCFKECPGQTMTVLAGILLYILAQKELVRSIVRKYSLFKLIKRSVNSMPQFDDTLFVFEGEDEEDAQEEEDNEDELLFFDTEDDDDVRNNKTVRCAAPKFL